MSTQKTGTVNADTLNIRPTPSTEGAPIGTLHRGQVVTVLAEQGDWDQIVNPTGGQGYVSARYLDVSDLTTIVLPDVYSKSANGRPDWDTLATDPRFFGAIIKALEGTSFPAGAPWFAQQWPALRKAGGDLYGKTWFRGCYHYLTLTSDGAVQAQALLQTVEEAGGWGPGDLPAICDVERGQEGSTNHGASKQQVIDVTSKWAETVKRALGGTVILYGRGAMRDLGITDHMGCDYLWAPQYNYELEESKVTQIGWEMKDVKLWQYTDGTSHFTSMPNAAPGIGASDMSQFLGSLGELQALVAGARR
jgi:GH25 family lysozyme M1 (1,4-beta-N-acetylmuramidase)